MRRRALTLLVLTQTACLSRELEQALADARERCTETSTGDADSSSSSSTTTEDTSTSGTASESASGTDTSSSTTDTTDATTAEPTPVCGNGELEPWGPEPEECDDGNLDPIDGCDDTCARDVRVFVTSSRHYGDEIMGVHLADAVCGNRAEEADLPEPIRYRAWLSTSEVDARDHIPRGRGRIVLLNGLVVADSWQALLSGDMQNPIDVTEKLEVYHGGVWTGTNPDGTLAQGASQCEDWMTESIDEKGHYGYSDELAPGWTLAPYFDNPIPCSFEVPLYCFEGVK